jgi:hypothetical protein
MEKKGVNYSIKKEFLTGKMYKPVDLQGIWYQDVFTEIKKFILIQV